MRARWKFLRTRVRIGEDSWWESGAFTRTSYFSPMHARLAENRVCLKSPWESDATRDLTVYIHFRQTFPVWHFFMCLVYIPLAIKKKTAFKRQERSRESQNICIQLILIANIADSTI